ncbi:nucleoside-diphosphate sugar epimerase [Paenibacillus chartarius]|uniref:Nucleoside-diphosphate sugar epimerase n=1 Tax=Paenibacillus chartarius TaxID=747481 RepID=A0ABV6DJ83_9BACL
MEQLENYITKTVEHMADSQRELVRIVEAEKYVVCHMAGLIAHTPDESPFEGGTGAVIEHSSLITKSISAYLNSLADLEDALATHLELAMKQLNEPSHDE